MRTPMLVLLLLVANICTHSLAFSQSAPSGSQGSPDVTYRSVASEVRLVFFATNEHNRPLEGLQKEDFAVVDDDMVIRDFRSFTRSGAMKLDVIVLFDSSESVLPHFKQEMTNVLQLVYQWPWSPEDEVSVLSFSGRETHSVCAGDCSLLTADRLASSPTGGSTTLFDALDTATSILSRRRQPDVWPVIILFSDGDDTISLSSFHDASEKLLASGVQVYAVDVCDPGVSSNGAATLQRLANDSGGRFLRMSEGTVRIFSDVIADVNAARVVTYVPPKSGNDFHSVRILPTHNLNLQFRCRRGYFDRLGSTH